jgi:electron transfer flavoprotein alpha subunit
MKKILVYLEPQGDVLKRTSYEVVSAANKLAGAASVDFVGLIINGTEEQAEKAKEYGLKEAIIAKHDLFDKQSSMAFSEAIAQAAKQEGADCILFAGNAAGMEIAPRVAAKFDAGYIADCIDLEYQEVNIIAKKPVYAGKAVITTKIDTDVKVFSLRPNVFTAVANPADSFAAKDFTPELNEDHRKAYVTSQSKNEGKLDVLEADIIVSGGRGMKAPENFNLIEDLAASLGAAVGASRAVVDAGWRPHNEQVGQTGKTVSPSMYVACGISGAVQHLAGMSSSKIIVAINKDKDAPIFKVTDYGIVGDVFEVLPKLTSYIKDVK